MADRKTIDLEYNPAGMCPWCGARILWLTDDAVETGELVAWAHGRLHACTEPGPSTLYESWDLFLPTLFVAAWSTRWDAGRVSAVPDVETGAASMVLRWSRRG